MRTNNFSLRKVAIITIGNESNYGNRLQNFALTKIIKDYGFEVETISPRKNPKLLIRKIISKVLHPSRNAKYKKRDIEFEKFDNIYIKYSNSKIHYYTSITKISNMYDYFILGSDQIWNPNFGYRMATMFGYGLPREKTIAYAASFGVSNIPEQYLAPYKRYLEHLDKISVRERRGVEIVGQLTGKNAVQTLDPTLLIDRDDYISISKKPINISIYDNFIVTYFLRGVPDDVAEGLLDVARQNNLKIINLCKIEEMSSYVYGPSEFLYLINNASLILTDSFHSCVFSIIFNKPFSVYDSRFMQEGPNTMSRIDSLLSSLGLQDRKNVKVTDNKIFDINYSKPNSLLSKAKRHSIEFLKNALKHE